MVGPMGQTPSSSSKPKVGKNRGNAGKGRPKGSPNKTTALAKQAIAEAFDKLGGVEALVNWAKSDPDYRKVFYSQIWVKILPLQVTGDDGGPLQIVLNKP